MLFHDAIDRGQTEAGTLAHVFGREEWIEDARDNFRRDAAARVGDAQADKRPLAGFGVTHRLRFAQLHRQCFNAQPSPARHGVAGVHHQVEQHLLHHPAVGLDEQRLGSILELHPNVLAEDAVQHAGEVRHRVVEIQFERLHDLLATEGKQLPRQVRRALGGPRDLLRRAGQFGGQSRAGLQNGNAALNHGQQIVEVMGHPAGEPSDGLHLLRLAELLPKLPALGHVTRIDQHPEFRSHAGFGRNGLAHRFKMQPHAVAPPETILHADRRARLGKPALHGVGDFQEVVRVNKVEGIVPDEFLGGITQGTLRRRTLIKHDAERTDDVDQVRGVFDEQTEALLTLTQLFLQRLALGDVPVHTRHAPGHASGIELEFTKSLDVTHLPIAAHHAKLRFQIRALDHRPLHRRPGHLAIPGMQGFLPGLKAESKLVGTHPEQIKHARIPVENVLLNVPVPDAQTRRLGGQGHAQG